MPLYPTTYIYRHKISEVSMENKQSIEQMGKFLEMSGTFLERAYALKSKVDSLSHDNYLESLRQRWCLAMSRKYRADAEVRAYRALQSGGYFAGTLFDSRGKVVQQDSVDTQRLVHTSVQWVQIWSRVLSKLENYCTLLVALYRDSLSNSNSYENLNIIVNKN